MHKGIVGPFGRLGVNKLQWHTEIDDSDVLKRDMSAKIGET